jgi:tRNA nucleotidyltransferase/poly(A) polymerase
MATWKSKRLERLRKTLQKERYKTLRLLAKQKNVEVYVVGGAVRDALLGKQPEELDFLVRGISAQVLFTFLKKAGRVVLVGRTFGVYKFVPKNAEGRHEIDVALPRTETASGRGGYRDFKVQNDPQLPLKKDLARRDFTVNAMAYDIAQESLVDHFGGLVDLRKKIVRTVGLPAQRFTEDYSRMLRAVRFSMQLGFRIEPKTFAAIGRLAPHLNALRNGERVVARELIGREFVRAFHTNPKKTIEILDTTKLLAELLPEVDRLRHIQQYRVYHPEGDVFTHTLTMLAKLPPNASLNVQLAALFHDLGKATRVQVKDLTTHKRTTVVDPKTFFVTDYDPSTQQVQHIGHEMDSEKCAMRIIKRLVLTQFKDDPLYALDEKEIRHNVRQHLLLNISEMRLSKAEPILFYPDGRVRKELLELIKIDAMRPGAQRYHEALKVIQKIVRAKNAAALVARAPIPLITGGDLVRLGYTPGPLFKQILLAVREAQLSKKIDSPAAARVFVKRLFKKK